MFFVVVVALIVVMVVTTVSTKLVLACIGKKLLRRALKGGAKKRKWVEVVSGLLVQRSYCSPVTSCISVLLGFSALKCATAV